MPMTMHGRWTLQVIKSIHNWENRFVIADANVGNGVYAPDVGNSTTADGLPSWELRGEYEDPSSAGVWQPAEMKRLSRVQNGAELTYVIGSEDPLPNRDFEDIQWEAKFVGRMITIPYRPYAVRMSDLFEMPDGIFDTVLGTYYMGVRVTNTWGESLTSDDVLDITPASRADLATRGVQIIDAWSYSELQALGQALRGTGIVLGPLSPGQSRTVYFKVNIAMASPRKHWVDFVCLNAVSTPDPSNGKRRVRRPMFISRSFVDQTTGEAVCVVDQGVLRLKLREIAIDQRNAKKARHRCPKPKSRSSSDSQLDQLRAALQAVLDGKQIDPCVIQKILACYCNCNHGPDRGGDATHPHDGRFCYDPFLILPTKFSYTITPRVPFAGQYGPIPFDDPWWKVLLAIIALILFIAAVVSDVPDLAYHDEDLVIGQLDQFQQNDIDAALTRLDGSRTVPDPLMQVLDAQTGELNTTPVDALDGLLELTGPVMTATEVTALLTLPIDDPQRKVFKSGGRTGLTHGVITGFSPFTSPRADDGTVFNLSQVVIGRDDDFGMEVGDNGDSGSIWVHTETRRPVALNHSGTDDNLTAVGSLLADVETAFGVTFS